MTNTNYARGRSKEYRIINKFKEKGYITARTAGSHSFFDVIAIDKENKCIVFIQSKPKSFSKTKAKALMKESNWLNNEFKVMFVIE